MAKVSMNGIPAAITTRSPGRPKPSRIATSPAQRTMSSMPSTSGTPTGCTPQTSIKRRAVARSGVSPRMGAAGRSRASLSAVEPELV